MALPANVAARMEALAGPVVDEAPAETAEVEEAPPANDNPVTDDTAATSSEPVTPEQADANERASRRALYEEKLAHAREKRASQRLKEQARAEKKAADEDRRAAAEVRAKYDGLKHGSIKETLEVLGKDPRAFLDEVVREAADAGTPEAEIRRQVAALEAKYEERLQRNEKELEALRHEREQQAMQLHESRLTNAFSRDVADPVYSDLRIEYDDSVLMDYVRHYDKNPQLMHQDAATYGVELTDPSGRFTMREILNVLKSAQDAHERGKQSRRPAASLSPETKTGQPTVNGTTARRNAATAIGNELASERASSGPAVSGSARERVRARTEEEIRRSERR